MTDYESTCDRLDQLAMRNLRLSNDLIRLKLDLDTRLRDGWLSMAKTRFLTGFHRFGKVYLADYELADAPSEDGAQVVVDMDSSPIGGKSMGDQKSIAIKFSTRIDGGQEKEEKKVKEEMEKKLLNKFGGLTPGSFKQGQRCFQTVLQVICEIATVESELASVIDEYTTLSKLKMKCKREG